MTTMRVPQESDEIVITAGGTTVVRVDVNNHIVEVSDEAVPHILRDVPGAEVVEEPATKPTAAPSARRENTETSEAQPARKENN